MSLNGRISRELGNRNYPTTCIYDVQEKVMDEFSVHMQSECVDFMQFCPTEVDTIVAGYTGRLQVLDVGINKLFKGYVKEEYEIFMRVNLHGTKPSRRRFSIVFG